MQPYAKKTSHKILNNSVEYKAVVVTGARVRTKVFDSFGSELAEKSEVTADDRAKQASADNHVGT